MENNIVAKLWSIYFRDKFQDYNIFLIHILYRIDIKISTIHFPTLSIGFTLQRREK